MKVAYTMVCLSLAGLTAKVAHAKEDHAEQKSSLLHPAQKQLLLAEHDRVHENIKRLRQVPRPDSPVGLA